MSITKRPKAPSPEQFIGGAPDAKPAAAASNTKKQISLTIEPALLERLDEVAESLGISRAAAFSLAVSRLVQEEKRR